VKLETTRSLYEYSRQHQTQPTQLHPLLAQTQLLVVQILPQTQVMLLRAHKTQLLAAIPQSRQTQQQIQLKILQHPIALQQIVQITTLISSHYFKVLVLLLVVLLNRILLDYK